MIVQSVQSPHRLILLGWVFERVGDEQRFAPDGHHPRPADDTEVLSQRIQDQGEIVLDMPQGGIPDAGHMGEGGKTPMDSVRGPQQVSPPDGYYAGTSNGSAFK